jgi:hypothetical protein
MKKQLANHVRKLSAMFYGLRRCEMMNLAYEFAKLNGVSNRFNEERREAGKTWLYSFCQRHDLTFRTPAQISLARAMGFNKVSVGQFFENLKSVYEKTNYPAHRVYNMDESGISTVPNSKPKVSCSLL